MSKKLLAMLMAAAMLLSLAAACGNTEKEPDPAEPADPAEPQQEQQEDTAKKVYKMYLADEVSSLNFLDNVDGNADTPANYTQSYLWRPYANEDGTNYYWGDDLAVGDPTQIDAYNWQIHLREGAKWHNGDPINADTWMFTFKEALNPKMAPRMSTFLADNAITIVNAKEYSLQGTEGMPAVVDWEDVGIKKVDDYTIQITTVDENSVTEVKKHFYNRNNMPVYEKLWNECLSADGLTTSYGSDLEHYMSCGPYTFDVWDYDSMHTYKKVEDHWIADKYHYDEIAVRIIPEMNARVEMFESGELYSLTPDANTIERYLDDPRMTEYGSATVAHIDINCKNPNNPITASVNYRKAIYHAIDRVTAADSIFGHMKAVGTYVNEQAGMLSDSALTYRESEPGMRVTNMVESWGPAGYNPEMAREYLAKAYEECNVPADTVITLKYACDESSTEWKALGEYMMDQFPVIFEGKLQVELVPFAGMSATDFKATGDDKWDLNPNDWVRGVSRTFPYACFLYYTSQYSGGPNNFHNADFDAQYAKCDEMKNGDYNALLEETAKLEEIYLENVIQCPVFQNVNYELFADCLQLPVKTYIPGFGWGAEYGDIVK